MSDPTPKKRATVAGVDKKIDDLVEIVDIMSTNVRQIKAALELIAEVVKKSDDAPEMPPETSQRNPMFGWLFLSSLRFISRILLQIILHIGLQNTVPPVK